NGEFCENVHGSLNENLSIIGIDGSFIESTDKYYQFTKTYRKIEQFTRSDSKNIVDVLDINIKRLIFYGHSLNEQDYSYFKSIFDFYNLYGDKKSNNNLHLVFYYSIYEGKDALTIKKDIFTSVIHLIHAYDKTYKSDHEMGNNLLHKLLIEKRIEIREFKPDDEQTFLASII
ncbi:MAG: hypothetical protein RBQ97_10265, partial [Acholeplasma sp.]|nr:hypothetical protein [Acholeplasma sp.]